MNDTEVSPDSGEVQVVEPDPTESVEDEDPVEDGPEVSPEG